MVIIGTVERLTKIFYKDLQGKITTFVSGVWWFLLV